MAHPFQNENLIAEILLVGYVAVVDYRLKVCYSLGLPEKLKQWSNKSPQVDLYLTFQLGSGVDYLCYVFVLIYCVWLFSIFCDVTIYFDDVLSFKPLAFFCAFMYFCYMSMSAVFFSSFLCFHILRFFYALGSPLQKKLNSVLVLLSLFGWSSFFWVYHLWLHCYFLVTWLIFFY